MTLTCKGQQRTLDQHEAGLGNFCRLKLKLLELRLTQNAFEQDALHEQEAIEPLICLHSEIDAAIGVTDHGWKVHCWACLQKNTEVGPALCDAVGENPKAPVDVP